MISVRRVPKQKAKATFRKQACAGEEMLSHNQVLGTKDRDALSILAQRNPAEGRLYKLASRTLAPATLSQRHLVPSTRLCSHRAARLGNT